MAILTKKMRCTGPSGRRQSLWAFTYGRIERESSFASNMPEGTCGYTLIGSHLDSVVEGGEYDGVVGVFAGLLILRELKAEGFSEPVTVAAFRCEESSNFKICTIGSGLITGGIEKRHLTSAIGRDG